MTHSVTSCPTADWSAGMACAHPTSAWSAHSVNQRPICPPCQTMLLRQLAKNVHAWPPRLLRRHPAPDPSKMAMETENPLRATNSSGTCRFRPRSSTQKWPFVRTLASYLASLSSNSQNTLLSHNYKNITFMLILCQSAWPLNCTLLLRPTLNTLNANTPMIISAVT